MSDPRRPSTPDAALAERTTLGGQGPDAGDGNGAAGPGAGRDPGAERHIGPYRMLQLLGEGGFGAVYLAEQSEPVKRRVALKVIKQGMDTRQVMARFDQERQALALMDHPGIAKVLDAGATESGRPYFVMELVRGEPITTHCDNHHLGIGERLELFAQVCAAVQHAHTKGIIHRDIKPSNVLVATIDGRPQPKVIDFGIAKATAGNLTERTLFTERWQMIGTPEYMSPEQAEGSLDIDTRTDVYALGVLLYELLTGSTPFDPRTLRQAAYLEVLRIIREVEPPRPSTRLGQSADTLATVAARRMVEPRRLGSLLRGELDWIVMKAIDKERRRRYESASDLATDVRRHLDGQAVSAAPPSAVYRARKFARRHALAVGSGAAVFAALLAAVIGIAWQAEKARAEWRKAQAVADFMAETMRGVEPGVALGRDTTMLREMMVEAAARIERGELRGAPEAELELRATIGRVFRDLALDAEAGRMIEPAVAMARSLHPGDHPATARAIRDLGHLRSDRGDGDGAAALFDEALAMRRRLDPGDNPETATDLDLLGQTHLDLGQIEPAVRMGREALAMRRRLFPGDHADVAESLNNLATTLGGPTGAGQREEAEALFREALAMNRRLLPADHPRIAYGLNNLSVILKNAGKLEEAEPLSRETLEIRRRLFAGDHPSVATALNNLALIIQERGDLAAPEPLLREAVAMRRRLYPDGHWTLANDLSNHGRLFLARGDHAAALPLYREAAALFDRTRGATYWPTGFAHLNLGRCLAGLGRLAEAEPELLAGERLLASAPSVPPGRHRMAVEALVDLYERRDRETPGRGHDRSAAAWRERLAAAPAPAPAASGPR